MKKGRGSRTAEVAAATRAVHHLYDEPVVFADPYALQFAGPVWRTVVSVGLLRWLILRVLLGAMRPVAGQVAARSRYAEDMLAKAVANGVDQYVIVGAGFDSFALRRADLASRLRVFELDHPDTQRDKRERVNRLGVGVPENLEFVGVDFEKESVADGLRRSGFQSDRPAFFSWLGTTPYLSNAATLNTLASIAGFARPGSQIVFDYLVPDDALSGDDRRVVDKLKRFTARRGEPLIGEFHPTELAQELRAIGFEMIEDATGAQLEERYFANRSDDLRPMGGARFAYATVTGTDGSMD